VKVIFLSLRPNYKKLSSQKIYLVRHGQTDYNLQGIVQGSGINTSLNETGRLQASMFYQHYKDVPFQRIYTSNLKRSQESVSAFIQKGVPYETMAALNEISWGNKEGQRITPEEDMYYHQMLKDWQSGKTNLQIEGGESPDQVAKRQKQFLEILDSRPEEKTILVCMHGRAIRILLCQMLNYPLRSMDMFEHENLGLYILNYSDSRFSIELYNNTDHLKVLHSEGMRSQGN
jgi:broad specificity phosphatase PhoE